MIQLKENQKSLEEDVVTGQWKKSEERALYLCNDLLDTQQSNQLVRDHWGIENKNHYVRDVSFYEDSHKIRKCPFNFTIIRSMAINFFRYNQFPNIKEQCFAFSPDWTKLYCYPHLI